MASCLAAFFSRLLWEPLLASQALQKLTFLRNRRPPLSSTCDLAGRKEDQRHFEEVWSIGVERERMALLWMTSVYFSFDQTRTISMTLIREGVGIICVSLKPAAAQSV